MSTYNGERFLAEQIDSILSQRDVKVRLLIRDDGSQDRTKEILKEYTKKYNNIIVKYEENTGWRKSYAKLIADAPEDEYYAFSDQDDFWFSEKLISAINLIEQYDGIPCLYRGRSRIADVDLNQTDKIFPRKGPIGITKSLFQNYCQGCNLVFNRRLRDLYLIHPIEVSSHDVWLPLIALHTGKIVDDPVPHMLYRVHSSNFSIGKSRLQILKRWMKAFARKDVYHYNFGEILYLYYHDLLNKDSLKVCKKMAEYRSSLPTKLSLFVDPMIGGSTWMRTVLVKYFILTNGYKGDI